MTTEIIERPQREDTGKLLSPPIVVGPVYQCATAVTVVGFVPGAQVEIEVDGVSVASAAGATPYPVGLTVALPAALATGAAVRARQSAGGLVSGWSAPEVARDHTVDFPAGPPRPEINPDPVFKCGVRTGVQNLVTGGEVWITADAAEVGRVKGCAAMQGVDVSPPYGLNQRVRAWFKLCEDVSAPSKELITQPPPSPLPSVTLDPTYDGGTSITVRGVVNGARVTLSRGGAPIGTWGCWGGSLVVNGLSPFAVGEQFKAVQEMCPGEPTSPAGSVTVQPCSSVPPPGVGPIQAGDSRITLTSFVPDAVIKVYFGTTLVGVGAGPVVTLSRTVRRGDVLVVAQDLGHCRGRLATRVKVPCVDPPWGPNPASVDYFPVASRGYDKGATKGSVYYPGEDDGEGQPLNRRLARLGPMPIVFMAHGNHSASDPSYLGYDYFQSDLAKQGIIAVSIDCNALNGTMGDVSNIEARAELILDTIQLFQHMNADPASVFFGAINFDRVGLMGHSRGGDAVVTASTAPPLAGVTLRAVLALAPTDFRHHFGISSLAPRAQAFMTVLPAGDGDVWSNDGARFYDLAEFSSFKSQLYVHFANHNYFNRQWAYDDSSNAQPTAAVMARAEHERVLSAYGCALFRATLLKHPTTTYLSGMALPAGVMAENVHLSYERSRAKTVDNHEDGNGIALNSLGHPTSVAGGAADEYRFHQGSGAFNGSFFGESTGMVFKSGGTERVFRSELDKPMDLRKAEVWVRAAEVFAGRDNGPRTGFRLGLEDAAGQRAWVDVDDVGVLPSPYPRKSSTVKTMLKTFRFKGACFQARRFNLRTVRAILLWCDRADEKALAFDDLQIVP